MPAPTTATIAASSGPLVAVVGMLGELRVVAKLVFEARLFASPAPSNLVDHRAVDHALKVRARERIRMVAIGGL